MTSTKSGGTALAVESRRVDRRRKQRAKASAGFRERERAGDKLFTLRLPENLPAALLASYPRAAGYDLADHQQCARALAAWILDSAINLAEDEDADAELRAVIREIAKSDL